MSIERQRLVIAAFSRSIWYSWCRMHEFRGDLLEVANIGRDVDFYDMYPLMSKHLLSRYVSGYDWISWPDQDEILEGPTRRKPYWEYLCDAFEQGHDWIRFRDFVYWYTDSDDPQAESPCDRVRHYSLTPLSPPKIRSWRASATNIRWFNHNPAAGTQVPRLFNLRHYPMRSDAQMKRRILVDRANIQRGSSNWHYRKMTPNPEVATIRAGDLHFDDGAASLNPAPKFDWRKIFGSAPELPKAVADSYALASSAMAPDRRYPQFDGEDSRPHSVPVRQGPHRQVVAVSCRMRE